MSKPEQWTRKWATDGLLYYIQDETTIRATGAAWWHWPLYKWSAKVLDWPEYESGIAFGLRRAQAAATRAARRLLKGDE